MASTLRHPKASDTSARSGWRSCPLGTPAISAPPARTARQRAAGKQARRRRRRRKGASFRFPQPLDIQVGRIVSTPLSRTLALVPELGRPDLVDLHADPVDLGEE